MNEPKVFVSHASEDKDGFVLDFAQRLRSKGIDAWVDAWEIQPGDSLVQKLFNEGLSNAQAVVIVLSKHSVVKPWVQEELDLSVIQKVTKGTRLIPVVIDDCEVPAPLRSTVWVTIKSIANYDVELDRIVQTIYGHSTKPPLGPPPPYVQSDTGTVSGLSRIDTLVLKAAGEKVISENSMMVVTSGVEEALEKSGVGSEQVEESLDVLLHDQYISSKYKDLSHFFLTTYGFHEYLRVFYPGYDKVTLKVATILLNDEGTEADDIAQKVGCPPIIVEHVFATFQDKEFIKRTKFVGGPCIAHSISPRFRRWLNDQESAA